MSAGDTHEALESLSRAVWNGASNPGLIRRADRIAETLAAAGHDDLAVRLRAALRTRGESLGVRYTRIQAIAADVFSRAAS